VKLSCFARRNIPRRSDGDRHEKFPASIPPPRYPDPFETRVVSGNGAFFFLHPKPTLRHDVFRVKRESRLHALTRRA
jgi:hypothetical protein